MLNESEKQDNQEKINCPMCNSLETKYAFTNQKFHKPFSLYFCKRCHGYFQHPLPNLQTIESFYQEEYYSGKANYSYIDERKNFKASTFVWDSRLHNIQKERKKRFHKKNGLFLDVGCSFGGFVQRASKHFQAYGLDISSFAVKEGNKQAKRELQKKPNKNFKGLYQGSLTELPQAISSQRFDVISLVEVIEHFENPQLQMRAAYNLLNRNGMLVIQTANFLGWQARRAGKKYHYFLPGHLVYFTDWGMKRMLNDIGFSEYKVFYPVDFSLWAKLKKSRYSFKNIFHYWRWVKITFYHITGKFFFRGFPLQSSYVIYAFK